MICEMLIIYYMELAVPSALTVIIQNQEPSLALVFIFKI